LSIAGHIWKCIEGFPARRVACLTERAIACSRAVYIFVAGTIVEQRPVSYLRDALRRALAAEIVRLSPDER
jgi:hypothetical protein